MATSSQVNEFRGLLQDLGELASEVLINLVDALDAQDAVKAREGLSEALPEVLQPYVTSAGELSAVWYEDLRADAGVRSPFNAIVSASVPTSRFDALAGWAVKPLFGQSDTTVASLLVAGAERIIMGGARDTVDVNARRDPVSVAWSRVARPDACEFCRAQAGRGAVYKSKQAAGMVIGRGVDPSAAFNADGTRKQGGIGGGVLARGSRPVGADAFHDLCHCTVVPTFYEIGSYTNPRTGKAEPALVPIRETPILLEAA